MSSESKKEGGAGTEGLEAFGDAAMAIRVLRAIAMRPGWREAAP